jgi:hypothetical protein
MSTIKVGDTVKLKDSVSRGVRCPDGRDNNKTAKIDAFLDEGIYKGTGALKTDRDLRGCKYWNTDDVELA